MAATQKYHHGDLRSTLLTEAQAMLREQGIGGLTLRGLAERAGVSRQAPYHYFKSKQALLEALAECAFDDLNQLFARIETESGYADRPVEHRLRQFVEHYVNYATSHPEMYELMFGPITWHNHPSQSLIEKGHGSFKHYAEIIRGLQESGDIPAEADALRLAQATWATLHGLCRLKNDGVFESMGSIEEISLYALNLMMAALKQ